MGDSAHFCAGAFPRSFLMACHLDSRRRGERPGPGDAWVPGEWIERVGHKRERRGEMNVAFIGLGNMGLPIARNLIRAGHTLTVYNRTRSRAEALESFGAKIAATPAEAAANGEALIT